MPSVLSWGPYFAHVFERGAFFKDFLDAKRLFLEHVSKVRRRLAVSLGNYSGRLVAASRGPLGPLGLNLDQNSKFELAAASGRAPGASGRAPGASGGLSDPRVVPDACPPCGQLVHKSCSPRAHLVFTLSPASAHFVPNSCPLCG